jgi:hypothetical protein
MAAWWGPPAERARNRSWRRSASGGGDGRCGGHAGKAELLTSIAGASSSSRPVRRIVLLCGQQALEVASLRCRFFPLVGLAADHRQLTAVA